MCVIDLLRIKLLRELNIDKFGTIQKPFHVIVTFNNCEGNIKTYHCVFAWFVDQFFIIFNRNERASRFMYDNIIGINQL